MILAFDTATKYCSVALQKDGQIHELTDLTKNGHATVLMPMIERILSEHGVKPQELSAIVVGLGPGSFTGIRIGISTALGLTLASGVKAYGVSSLRARSYFSELDDRVVLINARRNTVFGKVFGSHESEELNMEFPEFLKLVPEKAVFSGEDIDEFLVQIPKSVLELPNISYAKGAIRAYLEGHFTEDLTPRYLRLSEAEANALGKE